MLERVDGFVKVLQGVWFFKPTSNETIAHQLEKHAARQPDHPFLVYQDRRYTYAEANALVNRHADAYKSLGLKKGDVVALVLENRPEFYWHFLAAGKLGIVASLINTNIQADALAHAIRICNPKRIIVGSECWERFIPARELLAEVAAGIIDVDMDPDCPAEVGVPIWHDRVAHASDANPPETSQQTLKDLLAYIYTSGTTGMPKAALVRNHRFFRGGRVFGGLAWKLTRNDVMYNCLPLYHSNSILLASSSVITFGATLALARRFSASRFWDDCRRHDATCFIYIGELCRYLMNHPPSEGDRDHAIRAISGNGLRPDIWEAFQSRFGIDRIAEFYGSTEGNVLTINHNNTVGSVGLAHPTHALAKCDETTGDFVRDEKGFLVKCKAGEPGILLGKISGKSVFDGYQDRSATEKKIIRSAFKKGDAWFNTGDMLRMDAKRNLYFVDRLGDTFRWKGENVSTVEVQEQISKWPEAREVNVYGVPVNGTEGRAGMASLVLDGSSSFDPQRFKAHVDSVLPSYARPLFVRVTKSLNTTGTLKLIKTDLQKEGFDPRQSADPLYMRHPEHDEYVQMSAQLYDDVVNGRIRL